MVLKSANERAPQLFDGWPLGKELRNSCHFILKRGRIRQARRAGEGFVIAGDGHGTVLKEASPDPALSAAGDLPAIHHQLIS